MDDLKQWMNVGVHPTPMEITNQFALAAVGYWDSCRSGRNREVVRVADLFCGDGRLGRAVSDLLEGTGRQVIASFVEVDNSRFGTLSCEHGNVVQANAFSWEPEGPFDLIVSNPPYQLLTSEQSRTLGIPWDTATLGGRNLYSISILRALELCRPGGLVGVVAPFGWLRGVHARAFRTHVARSCSRVVVIASRERDRFGGPRQDTALQFFYRRTEAARTQFNCTFSYEHLGVPAEVDLLTPGKLLGRAADWRVRVGPLVWNRHVSALTASGRDAYLVVYGGNIRHASPLGLSGNRYRAKQFVKRSAVPSDHITRGPAILLRRTLRGRPGEWKVDSVAIGEDFTCVAENHVLCVELAHEEVLHELHSEIVRDIEEHYRLSGSPNISAQALRLLVSRRMGERHRLATSA